MVGRPLSTALQQKAESELNEVPSRIAEDLVHIREWIKKQDHLNCRTDDQWLLNYLRGCKFSLERTKQKLDSFYTLRSLVPETFEKRDPFLPELNEILKAGIFLPLPKPMGDGGPRIIYMTFAHSKIETMSMINILKVFFMVLDALLVEDDDFVISGMLFWLNYESFPLGYVLQLTPSIIKKGMTCIQECYPGRIKGIHYSNAPKIMESIFNIVKSFVTEKIRKRMSMHSVKNIDKFEELVPKKYWPKECGGENGSIPELTDIWKKKIEGLHDWFIKEESYGTNEKLRPKPVTSADVFGVEGAFRKLDLD